MLGDKTAREKSSLDAVAAKRYVGNTAALLQACQSNNNEI